MQLQTPSGRSQPGALREKPLKVTRAAGVAKSEPFAAQHEYRPYPEELQNVRTVSPCGLLRIRAEAVMDGIIYLVGLIVIIMFILSFLGLH